MQTKPLGFLSVWLLVLGADLVSGNFPKAQNVTWVSLNFKTLLTWSPRPVNYSYTVEFSKQNENRARNPLCIQTSDTECDLTTDLQDLKERYTADVLSESIRGVTSDVIEPPHTTSPPFIPYQDTNIGKPEFKIKLNEDRWTITIYVTDIPTAVLNKENQRLTIRDIFKDDLRYRVTYKKAKSSGKKLKDSASSEIELTGLDRGESYCINVQAYIPSRTINKQLGELSHVQCSPEGDKPFYEEYSLLVIAAAILIIIVIIAAVIAVIVVCCKRQQRAKNQGRERVPLKKV